MATSTLECAKSYIRKHASSACKAQGGERDLKNYGPPDLPDFSDCFFLVCIACSYSYQGIETTTI